MSQDKGKVVPTLTKYHATKTYWDSGGIASRILNLDTKWWWAVSFTPWLLYPRVRAPEPV